MDTLDGIPTGHEDLLYVSAGSDLLAMCASILFLENLDVFSTLECEDHAYSFKGRRAGAWMGSHEDGFLRHLESDAMMNEQPGQVGWLVHQKK